MKFGDYKNLDEGMLGKVKREPEEEYFHSIYITPKKRTMNDIVLKKDKLHIYGIGYNKDEVYMIPIKFKMVLEKIKSMRVGGDYKTKTLCFSFMDGNKSSTGRDCPANSTERRADVFCNECRASIFMIGMLCEENGKPINGVDGKPALGFIKGRGLKFSPVFEYYNDVKKLDPENDFKDGNIFEWDSKRDKEKEQALVNHKRFIVKIEGTDVEANDGDEYRVFSIERGKEVPKNLIVQLLNLENSQEFIEEYMDKFNKSKRNNETPEEKSTGSFDGVIGKESNEEETSENSDGEETSEENDDAFDFDNISLD